MYRTDPSKPNGNPINRIKTKIQGITASLATPNKRNPHLTKEKTPSKKSKHDKESEEYREQIHNHLYNKRSRGRRRARATRVAATLVALHIAADRESLTAAGVCAAEGLLASVRVGVNAQGRRARESLVAGTADIPVVVLLVRG